MLIVHVVAAYDKNRLESTMTGEIGAHHRSAQTNRPTQTATSTAEPAVKSPAPPDVFSLVAQENLLEALSPAFGHVMKVSRTSVSQAQPTCVKWS